ncbi:uncharacterized protein ACWYII_041335 isoform 1-T1 [Salvelinus alpinus]
MLTVKLAHLATPVAQHIYTCLKTQSPRLWGQFLNQASQSSHGLNTENNEDRKPRPSPGQQQKEQRRNDGGKERRLDEERKNAAEEAQELRRCVSVL